MGGSLNLRLIKFSLIVECMIILYCYITNFNDMLPTREKNFLIKKQTKTRKNDDIMLVNTCRSSLLSIKWRRFDAITYNVHTYNVLYLLWTHARGGVFFSGSVEFYNVNMSRLPSARFANILLFVAIPEIFLQKNQ